MNNEKKIDCVVSDDTTVTCPSCSCHGYRGSNINPKRYSKKPRFDITVGAISLTLCKDCVAKLVQSATNALSDLSDEEDKKNCKPGLLNELLPSKNCVNSSCGFPLALKDGKCPKCYWLQVK